MSASMRIRQIIRPLIPDRLMARYRLAQHSRQVRTNVDVVLTDPGERRRWLGATPDTYRVVGPPTQADAPKPAREVVAFGSDTERATRLLALPEAEVGLVARVQAPRIVGRKRREPLMSPVTIAAPAAAIAEVGGLPDGELPLLGLLDRLRDAGRRIALDPVVVHDSVNLTRSDPIAEPPVVILSAVPMHDVGGGSRATQLALEFVRRGYHVTYVALYGTQESADLGLRFIDPHLEQVRADAFDAALAFALESESYGAGDLRHAYRHLQEAGNLDLQPLLCHAKPIMAARGQTKTEVAKRRVGYYSSLVSLIFGAPA